jgi:hypothetical protein
MMPALGRIRTRWVFGSLPGSLRLCQTPFLGLGADLSQILRGTDAVTHLAALVHVLCETADDPLCAFRKVNVNGKMAPNQGAHA